MKILLFFCVLLCSPQMYAVDLNLENAELTEVIYMLAKNLHKEVMISPEVRGVVSLKLIHSNSSDVLKMLFAMYGLAKLEEGAIWYVASQAELVKRKEAEVKWQATMLQAAPLVTKFWHIKYGNAQDIAHLLKKGRSALLSTRGRVQVDKRTNILCVQEIAKNIEQINRLIARLDVPVRQILLLARIASVDNDFERELGVSFAVKWPGLEKTGNANGKYSLAVAKLADGSLLDVKLSALENAGHAELISNPSLFTENQQTASIEAGEEVPYQEVSESGGTAMVFKKAVLGMKVTPQVLPGDKVLLQLQINQDRPSNRLVLGVPTISTRQLTTQVLVKNGETVVLGGIYETDQENAVQRFPWLSNLPVLGVLFTQRNIRKSKRELLIFVTPMIIS